MGDLRRIMYVCTECADAMPECCGQTGFEMFYKRELVRLMSGPCGRAQPPRQSGAGILILKEPRLRDCYSGHRRVLY